MKHTENLNRLRERHAALVGEIAELQKWHTDTSAQWQAAVTSGDTKLDATTGKALDATRAALEAAQARLPLVAAGLAQAEIDALPEQAEACAVRLAEINRAAHSLGEELFRHYEAAQQCAATIRALHDEHTTTLRAHTDTARSLRTPTAIPHDARFVVNMAQMNHDLRTRWDSKFRMTATNIFDPHGLAGMAGAPDLDGAA